MTTRSTVLMVSTVLVLTVAGTASLSAQPMVLPLEADLLHRTGRVAVSDLRREGDGIVDPATIASPSETQVHSTPGAAGQKSLSRTSLSDDPDLASPYGMAYGTAFTASVERCRLDVARRLGVALGDIVAGTLTLRWTLEPSGRVQDVSVFASSPTDEGVMACAELVVASRSLRDMVQVPAALEWTHTFRKFSATPEKMAAQAVLR